MTAERGAIVMLTEIAMRHALAHGRAPPLAQRHKKCAKAYKVIR